MAQEKNPDTLYYYCNLETFFNIIKNRSLWLTDIGKSNDSLEQKYLALQIIDNIDEYIKILSYDKLNVNEVNNIANHLYSYLHSKQPEPVWAICFSQKGDDLSQWRGYGDDAKGICVGFKYRYLEKINRLKLDERGIKYNNDQMRIRHIEYGEEATKNYFQHLSKIGKPYFNRNLELRIQDAIKGLFYRPYYKHGAFKDEEEWRIVYTKINTNKKYTFDFDGLNSLLSTDNQFRLKGRFFDCRNGYIQSHIELEITDIMDAIDKIYIGSKCKVTKEDLFDFLTMEFGRNNYYPKITYSESSYR